jgi:hypothetical protein
MEVKTKMELKNLTVDCFSIEPHSELPYAFVIKNGTKTKMHYHLRVELWAQPEQPGGQT